MNAEPGEQHPFFDRPLVVVAEDDHAMRQVLWTRLTRAGYRVRLAADGLEAIERIRAGVALGPRTTPAVVVTDLRMAGMSGIELLVRLRRLHPELPVIVTTAFGDPEMHAEVRRLGAAASFDKPLVLSDLIEELRRVVPKVAVAGEARWGGSEGGTPLPTDGEARVPQDDAVRRPRPEE